MKLPQKFTLLGTKWTVKWGDLSNANKKGVTNYQSQVITIDPEQTPDSVENTYLHELLHVLIYLMGIDKALNLDGEKEEVLVNSLANGLYGAIKARVLDV